MIKSNLYRCMLILVIAVLTACGGGGGVSSSPVSRPEPAAVFTDDAEALAIAQFVFSTGEFPIELSDELIGSLGGIILPVSVEEPGADNFNLARLIGAIAASPFSGGSDIASAAIIIEETFPCAIGNARVFIDIADPVAELPTPGDIIRIDFNGCTDLNIEGTILPGVFDGSLEIVFRDYVDTGVRFLVSIEVEFDNFTGSDGLFSASGDGSFVLTSGFDETGEGSSTLEFMAPSLMLSDSLLGDITLIDYEFMLNEDFGALEAVLVLAGCAEGTGQPDPVCFDTIPDFVFDFETGFYESGEIAIEGNANSMINIIANGSDFPNVRIDFDGDSDPDSFPGWSWFDIFNF